MANTRDGNIALKCTFNDDRKQPNTIGFDGPCSNQNIARNVQGPAMRHWCSLSPCADFYHQGFRGALPTNPCYESALFSRWRFGTGVLAHGMLVPPSCFPRLRLRENRGFSAQRTVLRAENNLDGRIANSRAQGRDASPHGATSCRCSMRPRRAHGRFSMRRIARDERAQGALLRVALVFPVPRLGSVRGSLRFVPYLDAPLHRVEQFVRQEFGGEYPESLRDLDQRFDVEIRFSPFDARNLRRRRAAKLVHSVHGHPPFDPEIAYVCADQSAIRQRRVALHDAPLRSVGGSRSWSAHASSARSLARDSMLSGSSCAYGIRRTRPSWHVSRYAPWYSIASSLRRNTSVVSTTSTSTIKVLSKFVRILGLERETSLPLGQMDSM